jgi:hypothetical protein
MRLPAFLALSATTFAAVVVAAILVVGEPRPSTSADVGGTFFPALTQSANEIATIRIQKGDATTTLVQGDGGWTVQERGNYPVSLEKLKQLVVSLSQLRRVEAKTDRPERYASIGVEDVAPGAGSTLVTLADAQGTPIAQLLVGETPTSGTATDVHFVRVPGEPRAWLAAGTLDVDPSVSTWIDRKVISLPGEGMAEVQITRPDGKTLTAVKPDKDASHFTLRELPPKHRLKNVDAADNMAIVLTDLELQDLKTVDKVAFPPEHTTHARFRTFDGVTVDVDLVEKDDENWIRLTPGTAPGASAAAVAQAQALAERTRGYAFSVYGWKVAALKQTLSDLTEAESGS